MLTNKTCPASNTEIVDESAFFSHDSIHWDAHRIGWVVAGLMTLLTIIISSWTISQHARHYHRPYEQRQIIRILLMPSVYALISFFSYRFFRAYTYYSLIETIYEAFSIAAFLFLLVQYIGNAPTSQRVILNHAPKRSIPFPFCCWRYRPSKPYFLYAVKWLVLQYCILRPLITIAGIICEAKNVLCAKLYSIYFAEVYLEAFDFVVFTLALYGLIVFYAVTKEHLKGQSPLAKFLTIKGIVFFTFYQGFLFSILEKHGIIKGSVYWTSTNVSEGLQALCTTVEMVVFSIIMMFSFSVNSYKTLKIGQTTSAWKSFFHSQNYGDFLHESYSSIHFFADYVRGKSYTRSSKVTGLDFDQAYASAHANSPSEDNAERDDKSYRLQHVDTDHV